MSILRIGRLTFISSSTSSLRFARNKTALIEGRHFLNILQDALYYFLFFQGRVQFLSLPRDWYSFAKNVMAVVVIQDIIGYWYHRLV